MSTGYRIGAAAVAIADAGAACVVFTWRAIRVAIYVAGRR
jgi:hypothetical protein